MVAIPKSPGVLQRPITQIQSAAPIQDNTGQAIASLGSSIEQSALYANRIAIKEQEAIDAARLIDFKTKLSKFENEKRITLNELPTNDINALNKAKESISAEREQFVNTLSKEYEDNPNLASLVKKQAELSSVDFGFDSDRVLSSKKREYGQGRIYESIYNINSRLEKAGSQSAIQNARRDLEETVQVGLKSGLIDMQDVIREREKQNRIIDERIKVFQENAAINRVLEGKVYLDPTNSDDKKIVDKAYERVVTSSTNPEAGVENLILKTGIIPSQVKSIWRGRLNAGTPEEKIQIATNINSLIQEQPTLQNQLSSGDLDYISSISDSLSAGLPAQDIIKYADASIGKIQSMDTKARLNLLNDKGYKETISKKYDEFVKEISNEPGFDLLAPKPEVPEAFKDRYNLLVKSAIISGKANEEGAINSAITKMKGEWAITNIGRRRLQRAAPEAIFARYGDTSWIGEQFKDKIKPLGGSETDYKLTPIISSLNTSKPSYLITRQNEFGQFEQILDDKNMPLIFSPDIRETEAFKKEKSRIDEVKGILSDKQTLENLKRKQESANKQREAIIQGMNLKYKE